MSKQTKRDLDKNLLCHIPLDMPSVGCYKNANHTGFVFPRNDINIPNLKAYTPKDLGLTKSK